MKVFKNLEMFIVQQLKNGVIKGWNYHKKSSINYTVIRGLIKLVLYDSNNIPQLLKTS